MHLSVLMKHCRVPQPSKIDLRFSSSSGAVSSVLEVKSSFAWCLSNKELHINWCVLLFLHPHCLPFSRGVCFDLSLNGMCFSGRVLDWRLSLKNNRRIKNRRDCFVYCIGEPVSLVSRPAVAAFR